MKLGNELRSRAISRDPKFRYLPDEDRYLLQPATPRYRFNVIGTGINGLEHIAVTQLEGRGTIHGVFDPNPRSIAMAQQANKRFDPQHELVIYKTLEAACHDPAVDGLIICTPNYTHLDVVRVAAQSGKHILLEKPISTTLADALAITEIAESYAGVFQIGLQYRYKAVYSEAIYEAIERHAVGDIKMLTLYEHRIPFLDKVGQWNKFAKYSGDTLVEKCCHYFDLLNLFAGARPKRVFATGGMAVNFTNFEYSGERSDIMDHAIVIIDYSNGVRASFNLCMFSPMFSEELVICGDEGRLRAVEYEDFSNQPDLQNRLEIVHGEHKPSRVITPAHPNWIEKTGHNGATFYEHVHFIDNIEGKHTNTATVRDGLWSVIVALAAQQSVETGQPVLIDDYLTAEGASVG